MTRVPCLGAFAVCGLALALTAACGKHEPAAPTPVEVTAPAPQKPTVTFTTTAGDVPVLVDVARTQAQREQGLMFVDHLDESRGMIFLMGAERENVFWMKNTYIPLDMIFVNAKREVVGVVEKAEPLTTTPRTVGVPSAYVVEVAGGFAGRHGIAAGTKARFDNVE